MIIRELAAIFSFKYNPKELKEATSSLDIFAKKANKAMNFISLALVGQSLKNLLTTMVSTMDHINYFSANLGITVEALQELSFAADKSGISNEQFEDSLKELMIRCEDARTGVGEAALAFNALGIQTLNSNGHMRGALELLDSVADKISSLPTKKEQVWAADKLFGDAGYVMLSMLNKGSKGISKLREEARSLGVVLDKDAIKRAAKFNQALKDMRASSQGLAIEHVWTSFEGGDSVLKRLNYKLASWLKPYTDDLQKIMSAEKVKPAKDFINSKAVPNRANNTLVNFLNNYIKSINTLPAAAYKEDFSKSSQSHFAPIPPNIHSQTQNTTNQSIHMAINVQSGSTPQVIGTEVVKAFKRELEKERMNAFMGVTQYAN